MSAILHKMRMQSRLQTTPHALCERQRSQEIEIRQDTKRYTRTAALDFGAIYTFIGTMQIHLIHRSVDIGIHRATDRDTRGLKRLYAYARLARPEYCRTAMEQALPRGLQRQGPPKHTREETDPWEGGGWEGKRKRLQASERVTTPWAPFLTRGASSCAWYVTRGKATERLSTIDT